MSKLKVLRIIFLVIVAAVIVLLWYGTTTNRQSDVVTENTPKYTWYILIDEAGTLRLHRTTKNAMRSDNYFVVDTACCGNKIYCSSVDAFVYKNEPAYLPQYVDICGG